MERKRRDWLPLMTGCLTWPALLGLLLTSLGQAQDFVYATANGAVTITGYAGNGGAVVIPSTIDSLPVTGIGEQAFYYCDTLTSITLPDSLTSIGDYAFEACTGLTSITLPNRVGSVGFGAFYDCASLTNITIGSLVTNVGGCAFDSCASLTAITVDPGNSFYSSVEGVFFNKNQTRLIQCPAGRPGTYIVPDPVTQIGDYAFDACANLTSLTLPNSVRHIGSWAFEACTSLTAITVDASNPAFSSVDGVLFDKSEKRLIQCPGGKAGDYAVPNNLTSIGQFAFSGCASLTSVTMPDTVRDIEEGAFYYCTGLSGVLLGSGITNLQAMAFTGCASLTRVIVPQGVTVLGDLAFGSCPRLCAVCFEGNTPALAVSSLPPFWDSEQVVVQYLPGTKGWGSTFAERPTAQWLPQIQLGSPGVHTNRFGFSISWASGASIVIEVSTNLANGAWSALSTNTLTSSPLYCTDSEWTNYPARFYRIRSH